MRYILNISLPEATVQEIKKEVIKGGYASTSEFIRHVLRLWKTEQLRNKKHQTKKVTNK